MSRPFKQFGNAPSSQGINAIQHTVSSDSYPKKLDAPVGQFRNSEGCTNYNYGTSKHQQQTNPLESSKANQRSQTKIDEIVQGQIKSNSSLEGNTGSAITKIPPMLPSPKKFSLPFQTSTSSSGNNSNSKYLDFAQKNRISQVSTQHSENLQQSSNNNIDSNSSSQLITNNNQLSGNHANSNEIIFNRLLQQPSSSAQNPKVSSQHIPNKTDPQQQLNVFLKPQQDQNESIDLTEKPNNPQQASSSHGLSPTEISQKEQSSISKPPQNNTQLELRCRVHTSRLVEKVCLDQYCDFQRLICQDCEYTEHYSRHKQKCVCLSELMSKNEQSMDLMNWPQDSYLRIFQQYLKGQTNDYTNKVIEICNKTLNIMKQKMEEIAQNLLRMCQEEKRQNEAKLEGLAQSYITECCQLDGIRRMVKQLAESQSQGMSRQQMAEQEREIGQLVSDQLNRQQQFKGLLNQRFGFKYFESPKLASPSLIDFSLIEQEFNNIKNQLSEVNIFLQKNVSPCLNTNDSFQQLQEQQDNSNISSSEYLAWNNSTQGISFSTIPANRDKIDFKPDEKSVCVKRTKQPVFFFSNILPQQTHLQIRLSAPLKCGIYVGIVIDSQKGMKVVPGVKSSHFVGACMGCSEQIFGQCRTEGPGIDLFNRKIDYSDNESDEEDISRSSSEGQKLMNSQGLQNRLKNMNMNSGMLGSNDNSAKKSTASNGQDDDGEEQEEGRSSVEILNVFLNLKKKVLTMSDLSEKRYLKFDLDDRNFFYNKSIRFFVQTSNSILLELLQCNFL